MISVDEINKLKEELEIRDNLAESFRKEALNWANIANDYKKDRDMLENALEKIKEIALNHDSVSCAGLFECSNCKDEVTENGKTCSEKGRLLILQIISECEGENE